MRLPLWLTLILLVMPPAYAAMYWAHVTTVPIVHGRQVLRGPFKPLLDSKFAVVAHDSDFRDVADIPSDPMRSDVLLYEDGKLLGPAHSPLYEIAMLGHGRYMHWNHDYSAIAFSSSDGTDPRTNGRTYWTERPVR